MSLYVKAHYANNPDAPAVEYRLLSQRIGADVQVEADDEVVLLFIHGDKDNPLLIGKLASGTIAALDIFGKGFYNVPYIDGLDPQTGDNLYLAFIGGDSNKPIGIQNVDLTETVIVKNPYRDVAVKVHPPKNTFILPDDNVVLDFPRGDIDQAIVVAVVGLASPDVPVVANFFEHDYYAGDNPTFRRRIVASGSMLYQAWPRVWDYDLDVGRNGIFIARSTNGGINWDPHWIEATSSTLPAQNPSLAIDSDGNLHVVWYQLTQGFPSYQGYIYYRKYSVATDSWDVADVISSMITASSGFYPSIAISTEDPAIHVVWNKGDIYYNHRHTAGWLGEYIIASPTWAWTADLALNSLNYPRIAVNWTEKSLRTYYAPTADPDVPASWSWAWIEAGNGTDKHKKPKLVIDKNDDWHVVWDFQDLVGAGDHGIAYRRAADSMKTVIDPPTDWWDHTPDILVSGNNVWIIYVKNIDSAESSDYGNIWRHKSTDLGDTWPSAERKAITDYATQFDGGAYPTLRWSQNYMKHSMRVDANWIRYPLVNYADLYYANLAVL